MVRTGAGSVPIGRPTSWAPLCDTGAVATDDEVPADEPIVLGVELAAASAIERFRLEQDPGRSPLAELAYERGAAYVERPGFGREGLDLELRSVVGRWARLEPEELSALRSRLSMDDFFTLLTFARRSAALGLRANDPAWPLDGLEGLTATAYERVDFRDLTVAAALVAYALEALGGDTPDLMERAATRADPGTAEILRRFRDHPPQSLAGWGYAVVDDAGEISLVGAGFEPYAPTIDLLSSARSVGAAIDRDRYRTESITLATRLPPVWLRGGIHESEASRAVEHARAGATVRAARQPGALRADDRPAHHMFVVFLVEVATAGQADLVAGAATTSTGDHARLAVAHGPVVALLISRPVTVGMEALETDASLQRFGPAFTEALP